MTAVLGVGSVALDTIETPSGRRDGVLGGSVVYFSMAARHFAPVRLVGVVGRDFPPEHAEMLRARGIDITGLESAEGRTFRWHGRYEGDMGRAETVSVSLNVFRSFRPKVPASFADTPFVLLGNGSPHTQRDTLDQLRGPRFVMLDTMNLWIDSERETLLDLLPRVHVLCVNFDEARQLAGADGGARAVRKILDLGVKMLVVKRGEHGATLATREFRFSLPTYPTEKVVDPTGAGDSFAGGMLGYLAENGLSEASLKRSMVYGSVTGSLAVEEFGTERLQKATRTEIDGRARELMSMMEVPHGA